MFEPNTNVTVSVYIASKSYKDGKSPVLIRMTANRRVFTKKLFAVDPAYWDGVKVKRTHNNSIKMNQLIRSEIDNAESYLHDCKIDGRMIDPKAYFNADDSNRLVDILQVKADEFGQGQQFRTEAKYKATIEAIKDHDPKASVNLSIDWLNGFARYLRVIRKNKPNTVAKHLSVIRAVTKSPVFAEYKLPSNKVIKIKWSVDEIGQLNAVDGPQSVRQAVDAFVLSFCLWGARVGDVLEMKRENIIDGRIKYVSQKTAENFEIEINETAQAIIDRYSGTYLLPYMDDAPKSLRSRLKYIGVKTATINYNLKKAAKIVGIDKPISMHIARHSFGYAVDQMGLSLTDIQKLLGHSSPQMTAHYLQSVRQSDDLNRKVRGLNFKV